MYTYLVPLINTQEVLRLTFLGDSEDAKAVEDKKNDLSQFRAVGSLSMLFTPQSSQF